MDYPRARTRHTELKATGALRMTGHTKNALQLFKKKKKEKDI